MEEEERPTKFQKTQDGKQPEAAIAKHYSDRLDILYK